MTCVPRRSAADKARTDKRFPGTAFRKMLHTVEREAIRLPAAQEREIALLLLRLRSKSVRRHPGVLATHASELLLQLSTSIIELNRPLLEAGITGRAEALAVGTDVLRLTRVMKRVSRCLRSVASEIPEPEAA